MNKSILADSKEKSREKREPFKVVVAYSDNLLRNAYNARFKKPRIFYDDNFNPHADR